VLKLFILILCDCPSENLVGPDYYNQKSPNFFCSLHASKYICRKNFKYRII